MQQQVHRLTSIFALEISLTEGIESPSPLEKIKMNEYAWDVASLEVSHGARLSFHNWPTSRLEATRLVAPLGALYTPLATLPPTSAPPTALPYEPVRCVTPTRHAVLNPYYQIDFRSKLWVCPFCLTRNHFPPHYADSISETNLPVELIPQFTTCEYELPSVPNAGPPAFVFIVDICAHAEELVELEDSLQQALNLLPDDSLVALITFGTNVQVHELGFEGIQKNYVLRGNKEYSPASLKDLFGCGTRWSVQAPMNGTTGPHGGMGVSQPPPRGNRRYHGFGRFFWTKCIQGKSSKNVQEVS